uniref:NADH-ubiquinone oxidoreductase chain 6 n=1 Tax=Lophopotamon yenyuanense TaxID=2682935 RepID=A0A650F4N7_9EUCA|nr:NADH dehydrogenase subunit 6 [Lophopotamon yenyuanense]
MTMSMIPMIIILSFFFTQISHPLAMGVLLLLQTVVITLSTGLNTYSFWFSYTLFLIFLGGMLVLFIYVASLASNESFEVSPTLISAAALSLSSIPFFYFLDPILFSFYSNLANSSIKFYSSTAYTTSWIFNTPSMHFTFFIISYLLLTLLVVVKIINLFKGPLRLTN